ncbi:class I adenylate-forming enzyme family protein [Rhodococcus rhodochrous]|uniref:class I adenylate-forming enzyme family protein n=1 Tax=Rhodococcus rhodochrous TaxID=1829 RepID=UPI0003100763|nr:AMP-binding protein [Rhodococcus rhodochrous]
MTLNFVEALHQRVDIDGDQPFLLFEESTRTWSEAIGTVARLATHLTSCGITPGERVLLACKNSPTFIYSWFALRWIGATCVPLHTSATTHSIRSMVANAGIRTALGDSNLLATVLEAIPEIPLRSIAFDDYTSLERTVDALEKAPAASSTPSDECSILYTSGTTGSPKGVVLSEKSFTSGGRHLAATIGIDRRDRILVALPLFHINPQVYAISVAVVTGCSLALLPTFKPAELLREAVRHRATGFTYVGTLLQLVLMKSTEFPETNLRFCVGGGATPAIWRSIEERIGASVHELYGMTELGGWVTATGTTNAKVGTCGQARPDVEVAIVDDNDNRLDINQIGQIVVRPVEPAVIFDGYNGQETLTLSRLRNLWFHTGDLGELDTDGNLTFHGRADDMIRRGGENIAPSDVESAVLEHEDISEAAAVGVHDEVMGHEVKIVVVPYPDRHIDPRSLIGFLADRLPRFAQPRYIEIRETLPRTPTQKVLLGELRQTGTDVFDIRAAVQESE